MVVKFLKKHSINKVGSIAEYDKVLCDKLIKKEICVKASDSDIKADKSAKVKKKTAGEKALKEANAKHKKVMELHRAPDLYEQKEIIATWREKQRKKK